MSERYAPAGKVWLCMMCGKTAIDYCTGERGWDESCALNCILVDEATKQPTQEQARKFHEERSRRIESGFDSIARLMEQIDNGTWKPDPELLALAERVVSRKAA